MTLFTIAYGSFEELNSWRKCDLNIILIDGDKFILEKNILS